MGEGNGNQADGLSLRIDALQTELARLQKENLRLREENARLRSLLGRMDEPNTRPAGVSRGPVSYSQKRDDNSSVVSDAPSSVTRDSPADAKVDLFRNLFRGREDVYAVRWESGSGKSGYSPACRNEKDHKRCARPVVKCNACKYREFMPLTDQVIRDHLAGKHTIGVYPLLPDETCWFLAVDFDKATWQEDAAAFLCTCDEMGVPAALERSRSGNGAHIWIFFERPVPAHLARRLGCAILTRTMERRHQIGLDSYDRFFPNQDVMPAGGFGNLIALPLQRKPRNRGNTVFLDRDFQPYPDQWEFLSRIRRMHPGEVEKLVAEATRAGEITGVRMSLPDNEEEDPWTIPPSRRKPEKPITGKLPEKAHIVLSNLIYIEKEGLPPALLNRLVRLAAFENPEFYKAQAMRLSTFGKPRIIACAEDFPRHIGLPRGCLDDLCHLLETHGIKAEISDERFPGRPIEVNFRGELSPMQQQASDALFSHDTGILCAATGFGKTIIGAWLIAARKVNTLVLVHRRQLMDQWKEQLAAFLDLPLESIGQVGGGKTRLTGIVDIGMFQSLNRGGKINDLVAEYGQVIVDECHHLSAFSFEQVLRQVKAKYVTGLTATPVRKDGHHPIIMMQCGPIRFRVGVRDQAQPFAHVVIPRETEFRMPSEEADAGIWRIYAALVADKARNELILADLVQAVKSGRSPLLLTERTEHLEYFAERLKDHLRNVIVLRGGRGAKEREAISEQLASIPEDDERVLLATGRYLGEGFDDPRLDTLFLALPISWRGTLQQYAGRLHRVHHNKHVVQIYDYVDVHVPMLVKMYKRRLTGYKAIGYSLAGPEKPLPLTPKT